MTATVAPPRLSPEPDAPPPVAERRSLPRAVWAAGVLAVWVLIWTFTQGQNTLARPIRERTELMDTFTQFRNDVIANRETNAFLQFTYGLGEAFVSAVDWLQRMVSIPNLPRPVPEIGWLGVAAIAAWIALAIAGWRISLLVAASFVSFGFFGYWSDAMDLLIVTFVAVAVAVLIGMPIAVWIASSRRADRVVTVFLDLMQTMPTFVYLLPVVLFFGIGASAAVVCTLIYSLPPLIRIAGHGIRTVSPTTIEATDSAGQTFWQRLTKVQLPMARSTIVVGLNQTIMAALAIATVAAYVDGPGLGKPVLNALIRVDIGGAFVPGALIVVMAIMLDRTTTAASERGTGQTNVGSASGMGVMLTGVVLERLPRWATEDAGRGQRLPRVTTAGRWLLLTVLCVPVVVCVYLSRQQLNLAVFPDVSETPVLKWISGPELTRLINEFTNWFVGNVDTFTFWIKDQVTIYLINPLQELLSQSPWWVMAIVLLAVAYVLGGWRPAAITVVCEAVILWTGLWNDTMVTLSMTLIATALVMLIAVGLGVAMGRSRRADVAIRPFLDAFQVIPPFVYLVPALALFAPGRFTAIMAATAYAVPIATKLVADGIRGVAPTTVEAARSTGSTRWQMISKVQLPMARESLVLATNQGLLYVLSMVVIGGMVGGGSLGYIVVSGFSQDQLFGKGLCAGIAIAALGVMLDRIARYAAARYGR